MPAPAGFNLAFFFCENGDFLPPANLDHGGGGGIPATVQLRFRRLRVYWKAQDLLNWVVKAAPGRQVIVAVRLSTSWAALAGVANLDAAQEVS